MIELDSASQKVGLPPGSLVYVGPRYMETPEVMAMEFSPDHLHRVQLESPDEAVRFRDGSHVTWININGLHDTALLEGIGSIFNIHPLAMEDVLNINQRPKIEFFDDVVFIVFKMIEYNDSNREIESEQISLILCKNVVLTFQETPGDIFNPLRERIANLQGRLRRSGSDYLAYAILDVIVDNYFLVLEKVGDELTELDEAILEDPDDETLRHIYRLRRELIYFRKSVWPLRELVSQMMRSEDGVFRKPTRRFLGDLHDHTIQVIDTVETYREMAGGILDLYLSTISNRMNEVMKVLTIIATIFIPLSFLAGVYGMNFDTAAGPFNMPELSLPYGYLGFWGVTLAVGVGLLAYFRKKRWL